MHSPRLERAVKQRVHDWLGVPKGDVYVSHAELGEWNCIDVRVQSAIGTAPMEGINTLMTYLDSIVDGRVVIWTSHCEIELHPDGIPY